MCGNDARPFSRSVRQYSGDARSRCIAALRLPLAAARATVMPTPHRIGLKDVATFPRRLPPLVRITVQVEMVDAVKSRSRCFRIPSNAICVKKSVVAYEATIPSRSCSRSVAHRKNFTYISDKRVLVRGRGILRVGFA